jgi:hypothetical protein
MNYSLKPNISKKTHILENKVKIEPLNEDELINIKTNKLNQISKLKLSYFKNLLKKEMLVIVSLMIPTFFDIINSNFLISDFLRYFCNSLALLLAIKSFRHAYANFKSKKKQSYDNVFMYTLLAFSVIILPMFSLTIKDDSLLGKTSPPISYHKSFNEK